MDFVVVGLGIGAFAVLLGLAIRDLGPLVRRIPRDGSMTWAEVAERVAWGSRCRAGGLVIAVTGAALCLITGISLLARVSDSTGMWIVLVALAVAVVVIAAWAVRYQTLRRAPAAPGVPDVTAGVGEPAPRRARKSALAGIRGSKPHLQRRSAEVDRRMPADDPVASVGALTVDASGAMRRTPMGSSTEPRSAPSRARQQPEEAGPQSTNEQAGERLVRREQRSSGRGGQGPERDQFRR